MAFESLPVPEKVKELSLSRAAIAGAEASMEAASYLRDYTGDGKVFTEAQIEQFAAIKAAEAAQQCLADRISGDDNDYQSTSPGFIALIKPPAMMHMQRILGRSLANNGITFEEVEDTEGSDELVLVHVPMGGYEHRRGRIYFHDLVEPGPGYVEITDSHTTSVTLDRQDVVTIAGHEGDYWQNSALNLDGSPKQN